MKLGKKNEAHESGEEQNEYFENSGQKDTNIQSYIERNGKKVMYISLAVIALTAVFFLAKSYFQSSAEEARVKSSLALSRISPYYQFGDYERSLYGDPSSKIRGEDIIGLKEIVSKYKGSGAGKVAALYAGNIYLIKDSLSEAKQYFEIAADSDSPTVLEGAYAGLGALMQAEKNYQKAVDYFEKAYTTAISDASKSRYQYFAALAYEKLGNKEKTGKMLNELIIEHEFTEYASLAKKDLMRLGIEIE